MKYDYFAFIYSKHKSKVNRIFFDFKSDKNIKLKNCKAMWKNGRIVGLISLCNEPIKTHLVFDKLKDGKDSSWRNVLTEFYKRKVNDLNSELSKNLLEILKKDHDIHLGNIISFKLTLSTPFFTASENKFYSIQNPIAKERPTGLPVLKGSSLKGALRHAAIDTLENELIKESYLNKTYDEIIRLKEDRFSFKKRAQLVKLFGNEKDVKWFTFKTLLATGGIRNVKKTKEVLDKISSAFEHYLENNKITDKEGNCKGRLIFEDLHFKKVTLEVITPLDRKKRTPVHGPLFYEVVPEDKVVEGKLVWFPFDIIAKGGTEEEINKEWEGDKDNKIKGDKEIIEEAFKRLAEKGIGAKTKDGWGRFKWEEI